MLTSREELASLTPLVTLRVAIALFLSVALTLTCLWIGWIFMNGERALTECSFRNPSGPTTTDFTLFPPGYDCVYLNPRNSGEVVRRFRWEP